MLECYRMGSRPERQEHCAKSTFKSTDEVHRSPIQSSLRRRLDIDACWIGSDSLTSGWH